jgi:shikimate 5-dehydrogenase
MKVGLLGTGFGIAHAHIYHTHPQVNEVVVFGRTPAKLEAFAEEFGYATTTEVASIYDDPAVDLVDVASGTPVVESGSNSAAPTWSANSRRSSGAWGWATSSCIG